MKKEKNQARVAERRKKTLVNARIGKNRVSGSLSLLSALVRSLLTWEAYIWLPLGSPTESSSFRGLRGWGIGRGKRRGARQRRSRESCSSLEFMTRAKEKEEEKNTLLAMSAPRPPVPPPSSGAAAAAAGGGAASASLAPVAPRAPTPKALGTAPTPPGLAPMINAFSPSSSSLASRALASAQSMAAALRESRSRVSELGAWE